MGKIRKIRWVHKNLEGISDGADNQRSIYCFPDEIPRCYISWDAKSASDSQNWCHLAAKMHSQGLQSSVAVHHVGPQCSDQPVHIPLQGLPTPRQTNSSFQLRLSCRLTAGALSALIQAINKGVKQDRP